VHRLIEHFRAPVKKGWALWVGAAVSCTAFGVGFANDDLVHRLWLEGAIPDYALPARSLYEFTGKYSSHALVVREHAPWFTDPQWSIRFFRPLSSWSLALDHWLFGRNAAAAHAQSLAWLLVLIAAVTALLRRWLPARAAMLASLIYVLAGGHGMSVGWIASRHVLVGGALGAWGLWAHVARREGSFRAGVWLAPLLLVTGLCSSEIALGAFVLLGMYELFERREAARQRVQSLLPAAFIGIGYLVAYGAFGFGSRGSGAYLSPFSDPVAFARAALVRAPELAAELYGAVPSLIAGTLTPAGERVLALLGTLTTLGVAGLTWRCRAELGPELFRRLGWLGLASLACLIPMAGGFIGGRMLPLASIGSAAVIGSTLDALWSQARARAGSSRWRTYALSSLLVVPHFGLAPLVRLVMPLTFLQMEQAERKVAKEAEIEACPNGSTAYLLPGSDPTVALYGGVALAFFEPARAARLRGMVPLSLSPRDLLLRRNSDEVFELLTLGDARLSPFEALYRKAPMRVGDEVRTRGLQAEVLATSDGAPTRVRLRFPGGDTQACLLRWHAGALRRVSLAPGASLELPHEPGPMGF
jgi:hypothetical protein